MSPSAPAARSATTSTRTPARLVSPSLPKRRTCPPLPSDVTRRAKKAAKKVRQRVAKYGIEKLPPVPSTLEKQETFMKDPTGSVAMHTKPHSSENTVEDIKATKSATKANIDKTPSQPEITKTDMSVNSNVTKQATKYTEQQFSEATKYTEQQSSSCETPGCGEPAKLQCPTCIKLNIQGSFFCSQFCFKGNWDLHKALHKLHKLHKNKTCNTYAAHSLMASTEKGLACSSQQQLQQSHNSWRSLLE